MKFVKYGTVAALSTALVAAALTGVGLSANAEVAADYNSNSNVNFISSKDVVKPINPLDPKDPNPETPQPERPGTAGPLSIDFASDFAFGTQEITTENKTYMAKPQTYKDSVKLSPTFVQVTDTRGTNAGWTLNLKQSHQFKNDTTQNKTIAGAQLKFKAGELVTNGGGLLPTSHELTLDAENGAYSKVITAKKSEGTGTWVSMFGSKDALVDQVVLGSTGAKVTEKRDSGVTLSIPGSSQTDAVEYSTVLNWQLTNEPGN